MPPECADAIDVPNMTDRTATSTPVRMIPRERFPGFRDNAVLI
jgi:hypothetical protein